MEQIQNQQPSEYDQQASGQQYQQYVPIMPFWTAVNTCLKKYFNFKGRARRSEYWWFVLFAGIVMMVWSFVAGILTPIIGFGAFGDVDGSTFMIVLFSIIFLPLILLIIPLYSVLTRRLHDTGHSGWWIVASVVLSIVYMGSNLKVLIPMFSQLESADPAAISQGEILAQTLQTSPALAGLMIVGGLASTALSLVMLIFCILDSHREPNKYGPSPKYQ